MFQIKICGVTSRDDAREAVSAGADAIGLNFYAGSPRCLTAAQAKKIAGTVPNPVGVFVNASAERIEQIADEVGLDWVQLHGDEPPELLADIGKQYKIVRAVRLDEQGVGRIAEDLDACRAAGRGPDAVLVDAAAPGQYGGTGRTVRWTELSDYRRWLSDVPLILAGGLTAENVAEAIRKVRPAAVDVASGVERSAGVKHPDKVRAFVTAASGAFSRL